MAFKKDLFSKDSSRVSLLDRIRNTGASLRNVKPADVAFMAANVAVGIATKTLVVGSLAAAGVTASTILGGAAVAVAGGAAVGVARVGLSHMLKRSEGPLFSRENLKKVALGSAISAATFGVLSGADAVATHTEIGAKAAEKLTSAFNSVKGWLFGAKAAPVAAVAPVVAANDMPEHCELLKKPNGIVQGYKVDVGPSHPDFDSINHACEAKWGEAMRAERGLEAIEPAAKVAAAPVSARAAVESRPEGSVRKVAKVLAAAKAEAVVPHAVPANDDLVSGELKKVLAVTSQDEVNEVYAAERLSAMIEGTTGLAPAEGTSLQDMAAQIHPTNPEAYLKAVQQQAPQLDRDHVAAVVRTHVPKDYSGPVSFESNYTIVKPEMGSQDVVLLRDVNNEEPKKGIRVLWKAVTRALGGGAAAEQVSTKEFLKATGPGEVDAMVQEAQEVYQQAQMKPASLPQAALQ